jgi:hypothetical protein
MARPVGSKNRPGHNSGNKPGCIHVDHKFDQVKQAVIDLLESEEADNLSEAAKKLSVSPLVLYHLMERDKVWAEQIRVAQNIKADALEARLDVMNNPIGLIFRLKKIRPEYRDNYKFDFNTEKLETLLKKLAELGQTQKPAEATTEEPNGNTAEI